MFFVSVLCQLTDTIGAQAQAVEQEAAAAAAISPVSLQAAAIRDRLRPAMERLRASCDEAEPMIPAADWPFPAYSELLFSV